MYHCAHVRRRSCDFHLSEDTLRYSHVGESVVRLRVRMGTVTRALRVHHVKQALWVGRYQKGLQCL